jgi:hypothetical protein
LALLQTIRVENFFWSSDQAILEAEYGGCEFYETRVSILEKPIKFWFYNCPITSGIISHQKGEAQWTKF